MRRVSTDCIKYCRTSFPTTKHGFPISSLSSSAQNAPERKTLIGEEQQQPLFFLTHCLGQLRIHWDIVMWILMWALQRKQNECLLIILKIIWRKKQNSMRPWALKCSQKKKKQNNQILELNSSLPSYLGLLNVQVSPREEFPLFHTAKLAALTINTTHMQDGSLFPPLSELIFSQITYWLNVSGSI